MDVFERWLGLTGGERAAALSPPDPLSRIVMKAYFQGLLLLPLCITQ